MFEYYDNIYVIARGSLGSIFSKLKIFSSVAHFLQDFPFKWQFLYYNAQMTYVHLAVK